VTRPPTIRFGPFELDPVRRTLRREGRPVALSGKPMDLLVTLIEHRDRVLSRGELLATVWPDVIVEEANLTQNVSVLRKTLAEGPGDNTYILTVTGRGYRFVAPVESGETGAATHQEDDGARRRPTATRAGIVAVVAALTALAIFLATRGPSQHGSPEAAVVEPRTIAVLPLITGEFDQPAGGRGIGLADAVINRLAERGLAVRPTRAIVEFADPRRDAPDQAGRALGAGIVVTGSLRDAGGETRVSLQIIAAKSGNVLWAGSLEVAGDGRDGDGRIADAVAERLAEPLATILAEAGDQPALLMPEKQAS
jgi:DNA-binding winged helix-turn-helix (wHTH) protein/TolB-like protein